MVSKIQPETKLSWTYNLDNTRSAMVSPIDKELVAAGDGALQTCMPDLFSTR